jgi:hypothetical protein
MTNLDNKIDVLEEEIMLLQSRVQPHATGHIITGIGVLKGRIEELKKEKYGRAVPTVSEMMQAELEPIPEPDWPTNDGRIDAIGQNGNDGLHYDHVNQEAQDEIAFSTGKLINEFGNEEPNHYTPGPGPLDGDKSG